MTLQDELLRAQQFAMDHINECAHEMLEWHNTSVLREGRVRELARMCHWAENNSLNVACSLVEQAAYTALQRRPYHESS